MVTLDKKLGLIMCVLDLCIPGCLELNMLVPLIRLLLIVMPGSDVNYIQRGYEGNLIRRM